MKLSTDFSLDAYRDLDAPEARRLARYTAFVRFAIDGDDENATEEIDVDAFSAGHAREIAKAALARDYDPGGKVVEVEERVGWYL